MRREVDQESFYMYCVDVQLRTMPGQWFEPLSPLLANYEVQRYPLRNIVYQQGYINIRRSQDLKTSAGLEVSVMDRVVPQHIL